jgi:hypothetical protein
MTTTTDQRQSPIALQTGNSRPRGPVSVAWREGALTRVEELKALCSWVLTQCPDEAHNPLVDAIELHLEAARQAAEAVELQPKPRLQALRWRNGPLIERAMSNIDAAEAQLLNIAPSKYVLGQLPSLLSHVQLHLTTTDPRRREFERIARKVGVKDADHPLLQEEPDPSQCFRTIDQERGKIVTAFRGASSAALREQLRLRDFRSVLVVTTLLMTLLAVVLAIVGFFNPTLIPLCFAPEEGGEAIVVCPTAQSAPFSTTPEARAEGEAGATEGESATTPVEDIDDAVRATASPYDLLIVELIGLSAAAIAAAAAIRRIRGSSERYGLPVALAALKLPTGAMTAFLGLLLMRGQFVPGLSALDTSAQILAWALVFGYAQQLFTRLVDQQGQTVLASVRSASSPQSVSASPS